MGDGAAERCSRRRFRIDMDELMIAGDVREAVDRLLTDLDPRRDADFAAELPANFVETGNRHLPTPNHCLEHLPAEN